MFYFEIAHSCNVAVSEVICIKWFVNANVNKSQIIEENQL